MCSVNNIYILIDAKIKNPVFSGGFFTGFVETIFKTKLSGYDLKPLRRR